LIALIINAHPKIDELDAEYCSNINACLLLADDRSHSRANALKVA